MSELKLQRQSQFELIRILAQFFIVFYHIFFFFVFPTTQEPLHKAIWLPLHIGVILFILISGYFGINASIKGFIKLLGMMVVLYVPLGLANYLIIGGGKRDLASFFLIVSATPFWFMRTYIFLYLFSPVINLYLKSSGTIKLLYIIIILGFISHYSGTIGIDPSLHDGKNLITFLFLYSIGFALHKYKYIWKRYSGYLYGFLYLSFNTIIVVLFSLFNGTIVDILFNKMFYSYCSFGLLLSSIFFFLWIGSMKFKSKFINYIAKSSLTIYMVHGSSLIFFGWIGPFVIYMLSRLNSQISIFLFVFLLTIAIVTVCIMIDKLLSPVWKIINTFGAYTQNIIYENILKSRISH